MDAEGTQKKRRRRAKSAAAPAATPVEADVQLTSSTSTPTPPLALPKRKRARPSPANVEPTLPSPPPAPRADEKDEEEAALESFLFGGLLHAHQLPFGEEQKAEERETGETTAGQAEEGESLFVIDKKGTSVPNDSRSATATSASSAAAVSSTPVWHDPDDEQQLIDLAAQPRLRKLRASASEQRITAADYQQRLRQTYTNLNHAASWVKAKRATGDAADDEALWDVLRTSRSIKQRDTTALPSGHLDIQALKDANAQQPAQVRPETTTTYVCAMTRQQLSINFRSADTIG